MTVAIAIQTPTDKSARVIQRAADGAETTTDVPAGASVTVYAGEGVTVTVSETEPENLEARTTEPQLDSGGGGHGDPDKPGPR